MCLGGGTFEGLGLARVCVREGRCGGTFEAFPPKMRITLGVSRSTAGRCGSAASWASRYSWCPRAIAIVTFGSLELKRVAVLEKASTRRRGGFD